MEDAMTDSASPIGTIIALKGQVWAESESGLRPLETGSPVYQGEKIVTGPDSNAEIRFLDDTCLSQGANSALSLDHYVYNPADESAANLGFGLLQGAFRHVSGKIATTNPENVQLESPLAVIGIRGTTTVHSINPETGDETHGVEHISEGHRVIIQDSFGEIRIIDDPLTVIDLSVDAPMGFIRPMTPQELEFFQSFAPGVLELFGFFVTPEELFALLGGAPGEVLSGSDGEGAGESDGKARVNRAAMGSTEARDQTAARRRHPAVTQQNPANRQGTRKDRGQVLLRPCPQSGSPRTPTCSTALRIPNCSGRPNCSLDLDPALTVRLDPTFFPRRALPVAMSRPCLGPLQATRSRRACCPRRNPPIRR
jgi:hypothetical protein